MEKFFTLNLGKNRPQAMFGIKPESGTQRSKRQLYHPAPEGHSGVSGTQVWVIKAVAPGSQEVRGINGRFWENITGNEESFTLNINVVSQNISSRNWDFGDEITSNEQNPMHTFSAPGTYIVTLTASNENGKKSSKKDY
jgi:predicted secreted protein